MIPFLESCLLLFRTLHPLTHTLSLTMILAQSGAQGFNHVPVPPPQRRVIPSLARAPRQAVGRVLLGGRCRKSTGATGLCAAVGGGLPGLCS